MADLQAPGGYFIGRPANYEPPKDPAADEQNPGSTGGTATSHDQNQAPAPGGPKKPGFFGNLFSCFSPGSRAES
ncbi:hypothetical protein BS78_05G123200 [Paspalum vaginatum]|nr:hypothetical protein BS78_05G123200 [Paspalum vaginatum]